MYLFLQNWPFLISMLNFTRVRTDYHWFLERIKTAQNLDSWKDHLPTKKNIRFLKKKTYLAIYLIWPPPCNSDHQDYYMFSRGFLLTFTFHCYREGAISKPYISFVFFWEAVVCWADVFVFCFVLASFHPWKLTFNQKNHPFAKEIIFHPPPQLWFNMWIFVWVFWAFVFCWCGKWWGFIMGILDGPFSGNA